MTKVAIITPSVGNHKVSDCVQSTGAQTYDSFEHLIVVDGAEYQDAVKTAVFSKCVRFVLPYNTGRDGFYGHRIYGAMPFLVPHQYVTFLDEDNFIQPNHIESMVSKLEADGLDWVYSLRSIYSKEGEFICDDEGESLGRYTGAAGYNFVDTSCYLLKREVAVAIAPSWWGKWAADRVVYKTLSQRFPRFDTTGLHTLCYRLDGNPTSPNQDFFKTVNAATLRMYEGNLPWKKKQ